MGHGCPLRPKQVSGSPRPPPLQRTLSVAWGSLDKGFATGFTPTRGTPTGKQVFGTLHVDQSAQIYVDYEQDAPVARCRERRAVSPMAASASVDKALAGWRTRRRHTNRCNAYRVFLVGGRR